MFRFLRPFNYPILHFLITAALTGSCVISCTEEKTTAPPSGGNGPVNLAGWNPMASGTSENLNGVWCFDADHAFAVGDNGTILFYDGGGWTAMNSGVLDNLIGVCGRTAGDVFATGTGGTVLHFDGLDWTRMVTGVAGTIGAVCVSKWGEVFAVGGGADGSIMYYGGSGWTVVTTGAGNRLTDVWGAEGPGGPVCAVGLYGTAVYFDGIEWHVMDTGIGEDLVAVYGKTADRFYAVGVSGALIQYTGLTSYQWFEVDRLTQGTWTGMAARSYNDLFIVGKGGKAANFDRCQFTDTIVDTMVVFNDVWAGTGDDVFAVGDGGSIYHFDDPPEPDPCPDIVSVTVGSGVAPTISWEPDCPVSAVVIREERSGASRWFLSTDGNLIESGLSADAPPDCSYDIRPWHDHCLEVDSLYRVELIRSNIGGDVVVGTATFTADTLAGSTPYKTIDRGQSPAKPAAYEGIYVQKLRLLMEPIPGQVEETVFYDTALFPCGPTWGITNPEQREGILNIRPVRIHDLIRDPDTGQIYMVAYDNFRAADLPVGGGRTITVIWDEMVLDPGDQSLAGHRRRPADCGD